MGCPAAAQGRRRWAAVPVLGRPALESGCVGGREDRGVPDVLHEPAVPAERRAQQHRHAGPQAGGHQAPAARHRPVSAGGSRGGTAGLGASAELLGSSGLRAVSGVSPGQGCPGGGRFRLRSGIPGSLP